VNVSVYIDQGSHRRGLGRSLYARLFEILIDLGYVNAYAGITLPNPASVGFHTSMGFTPVGVYDAIGFKYGKWHDVAWFQKALRPRPAEPELPRSIGG
jgi:phosphinothricin acetyltransferase